MSTTAQQTTKPHSRTETRQTRTKTTTTSSSALDFRYVPASRVDEFWPKVEGHVSRAVLHTNGAYRTEDIHDQLLRNEALLWLVYLDNELTASVVTEVVNYPSKSVLVVVTAGGKNFHAWISEFLEILKSYRDELELDSVVTHCRPGMAKWLSNLGCVPTLTTMELRS